VSLGLTGRSGTFPLLRQLREDRLGMGRAVRSRRTDELRPRTEQADRVVKSICPYCAVGCGQLVYVRDEQVIQIEGDPDSPISRGRLCPKGSASKQLVTHPRRETNAKYRAPGSRRWEEIDLEQAMDMIADRLIATRERTWEATREVDGEEVQLNRTLGVAHLGGATLDNEENYLIKKFFSAAGAVSIENQARI
jgi:formate dehydrogenase major subunit